MVLGKRLKGAFKAVMACIKQLSSEELEQFQKSGVYFVQRGTPQPGGVLLLDIYCHSLFLKAFLVRKMFIMNNSETLEIILKKIIIMTHPFNIL